MCLLHMHSAEWLNVKRLLFLLLLLFRNAQHSSEV